MPRPSRNAADTRRSPWIEPLDPGRHVPTPQRPVRAKARRLGPDSEIQPHRHPWAQVVLSVQGVIRVTAGDGTFLVPAGRAVWIPPRIEHMVSVVESAELRTLYVHADLAGVRPGCRVLEVSPLLRELVLQMDVEADGDTGTRVHDGARERRLGELALDELHRAAPVRLGIELPQDKRLRALCEAVVAEPARHASLDGWAADAGASPRTVARLFRQQLGTSFGPWRQQVLLAHAMTLAAQGRPMSHIASELGYASASAFTAMVRRSVGAPPRRFFAAR
jgi:AraC-like DNA-binding protein/mannose-6-phosphate isomerase-like protein (cupin superfamily)